MRASVKALPSQVKAEVVYSADWRPCFFLKVEYFARPSKKLRNAHVQVPQSLLGRDRGDLVEPSRGFLLFQGGECCRGISIEKVFPTLPIGIPAQSEHPVKHKTRAAERPSEHLALARRGIEPVPVGALVFHVDLFFWAL